MKNTLILGLALATVILAGCDATSGISARIQEKSAIFEALSPEQKKAIAEGAIEYGDTADMVYMPLGKPSKTR